MTHRLLLTTVFATLALCSYCQSELSENEKKYLVYTVQPGQKPASPMSSDEVTADEPEEEVVDSMKIWFPNISLCDWRQGMRFMVIPDKKDLVIKTFVDKNSGRLVPSHSLLHKVMVYQGHDFAGGGLHEHINFRCEETGDEYYYEVPTKSFDDYCYQKFGVPTLAYLGEVDSARVRFTGRRMLTVADRYYIDDPTTSEGFVEIHDVDRDTEVEVVAVGVGTRSFPVKIIVKEVGSGGRQFFQNVCISKTNSGLRDEELEISDMKVHTFNGSFVMADDNLAVNPLYQKYQGQEVYTLLATNVEHAGLGTVRLPRLTQLTIRKIRSQSKSEYAKVTLYDSANGKTYTKDVLFKNRNLIGVEDKDGELYVEKLFALGNPKKMKGVREENMTDLSDGVVRIGFTANEVLLALGEPTSTGRQGPNTVWYYYTPSGSNAKKVVFNAKTMRVAKVTP